MRPPGRGPRGAVVSDLWRCGQRGHKEPPEVIAPFPMSKVTGSIVVLMGRDRLPPGRGHGSRVGFPQVRVQGQDTGRLLGVRCPDLRDAKHRSWYFSADLPSAAGQRRRVRRGVRRPGGGGRGLEALASPAAGPEPGLSTVVPYLGGILRAAARRTIR